MYEIALLTSIFRWMFDFARCLSAGVYLLSVRRADGGGDDHFRIPSRAVQATGLRIG